MWYTDLKMRVTVDGGGRGCMGEEESQGKMWVIVKAPVWRVVLQVLITSLQTTN